ncbi:alanine dehydrogenase [Legionella sp. W05-934-2]|jgi:alanine dehydrogenase|uniref:alanine dehydrogenase n=1 Tax=Legionella sp. W05-934-2 TaxID=1198649 RepID=UPI003461B865
MLVGVPKEIKPQENRVGLVPGSVREIIRAGSKVIIEKNAGLGISISDDDYKAAGAEIVDRAEEIFERADLVVKVKEPQPIECKRLREGQTIFTYLHLAPDPQQTKLLKESKATAIAYETVTQSEGGLPLLTPMSQVAGRMSIQAGAHCLEMAQGGSGMLLGGVPGVAPASVVVIGGGVVGTNAVRMAMGMEAYVTVVDKSLQRLRELDFQFGSKLNTIYATQESMEHYVTHADLVIGAVLVPGAAAPKLVTRKMLREMRPGSVVVDVAIDQGGCFETSRPTTHLEPTYVEENVVHYCVANMPGAVPRTSTFALNNATLPYIISLVTKGVKLALLSDGHLLNGLNVHKGMITYEAVARDLKYEYVAATDALAS